MVQCPYVLKTESGIRRTGRSGVASCASYVRVAAANGVGRHGFPHPITGSRVVLTCAHIGDQRPEAASLLNLAALCQRCHNRHDAAARVAGRKARALDKRQLSLSLTG